MRNLLSSKNTWWQDCPPATNFMLKIFKSLKQALIKKMGMIANTVHNSMTLHAGIFHLVKK